MLYALLVYFSFNYTIFDRCKLNRLISINFYRISSINSFDCFQPRAKNAYLKFIYGTWTHYYEHEPLLFDILQVFFITSQTLLATKTKCDGTWCNWNEFHTKSPLCISRRSSCMEFRNIIATIEMGRGYEIHKNFYSLCDMI